MHKGWFGVPWFIYAIGCLLIAIGYGIFSGGPLKNYAWTDRPLWKYLVLRWFHALVWLLLSIACLMMHWKGPQGTPLAKALALIGLICYLIYLTTFFVDKNKFSS